MIERQEVEVSREGQVTVQLKRLENELSELESGLTKLRDRLSPVLGASLKDDERLSEDAESLVPLAAKIRGYASIVNRMIYDVTAVYKEIEL